MATAGKFVNMLNSEILHIFIMRYAHLLIPTLAIWYFFTLETPTFNLNKILYTR